MDQFTQSFQQAQFILRYLRNELTTQEKIALDAWLAESVNNQTLFEELTDEVLLKKELAFFNEISKDTAWQKLEARLKEPAKVIHLKPRRRRWYVAAAVIALLGIFVVYQFDFQKKEQMEVAQTSLQKNDIAPGGNVATLTLADGSTISLDSANTGSLAQQGQSTIIKLEDGQLVYEQDDHNLTTVAIQYNTVSTPRGGQYQLVLADSSKVWLNAESSIRFPVSFTGEERNVEITGEAYFEVAHNASKPFKVKNVPKNIEVEVLGTHFNMNTYDDEASLKIMLLEGSVRVSKVGYTTSKVIKPGEQAQVFPSNIKIVTNVDIENVIAWKNGYFLLSGTSLESLMKQISRWYDVDVFYEGKLPEKKFGGSINRNVRLTTVLEALKVNGISSKLEGKKLSLSGEYSP